MAWPKIGVLAGFCALGLLAVGTTNWANPSQNAIRYVALGDSYTIGTGAPPGYSWPQQLVRALSAKGISIELVDNLARNGWASQHVIQYQLPVFKSLHPTFTTVLVGANDISRGEDIRTFALSLRMLLNKVQEILPQKEMVVLLTVPDFSVTPQGKLFGADIQKRIMLFNQVIKQEAQARGLMLVDLFSVSQAMGQDQSLVAKDGLHPSAKAYRQWAEVIFPAVYKLLEPSSTKIP